MSRRFDHSRQFSVTDRLPYITDTNDCAVELASLDVQVVVTGLFAETTQTLRLHNPNRRDLEGNLCFPLPDDAVVCGFGLDVDGRLIDGVVVPKEEARRILESEIRKGVDPGLVEQVQGNVYRTRIYPLPAGGNRTVKIVYISRLTVEGNDAAYHLPLGHADGVGSVSLRVEVSQTPVRPALVGGLGNLSLNLFENRWVAEATFDPSSFARLTEGKSAPAEDLQIRLPNLPAHLTAVERFGAETFFCISSKMNSGGVSESWVPRRVAVLWDASGSRQDVNAELAVLEALAATWQQVVFDVRLLRDVSDPEVHSFATESGDCTALRTFLEELAYDGGTHLAGVEFGQLPHPHDDAWLLFSDGLNTVGKGLAQGTHPRIFAITGQPQCDGALLGQLAERSGGAYFNLLKTEPAKAAVAIASWNDALRLERATDCEDVHVFVDGGRLTIVGRLTAATGSVQLTGPGAPSNHLTVATGNATEGRNIARAWAGRQAQLERLLGSDEARIIQLGRTYGLVTPGTSLLVLENLDQYLEYDIEPPETLPSMRKQFRAQRKDSRRDEDKQRALQIERVLAMWQQRVAWWETDFAALREQEDDRLRQQRMNRRRNVDTAGFGGEPNMELEALASLAYMPAPAPLMMMRSRPMTSEPCADDEECEGALDNEAASGPLEKLGDDATATETQAVIRIKPWSPDTPYLSAMKAASTGQAYASYLGSRDAYALSPAFFLDCSDFLLASEQRGLGLRVLSNLLELALDDPALLRMYAWRMQQAGEFDQAVSVLERVLAKRDDEPQSHRDLALALEQRWQRDGDESDAIRAMALLYAVITRTWDRFPEIELIALVELNRLIHLARNAGIAPPADIDARLIRTLDLDVRISMSWDADLTDVDLHVFEPTGEHAYYGHRETKIGGLVSRDFTQGYGPEEYVLKVCEPGDYTIKAHYYGSHQQTVAGPCTVVVTVFTNYARPNEEREVLTLRLDQASDDVIVGTINIPGRSALVSSSSWQTRFRTLKRGMSIDEIVAIVGQPEQLRGSEETVLVYHPTDAVEIHVFAAPRLTLVRQMLDGATLELL